MTIAIKCEWTLEDQLNCYTSPSTPANDYTYVYTTHAQCIFLVLDDIRKIRWYGIAIKILVSRYHHYYIILLGFYKFMAIFAPQCINSHIKCSTVSLELIYRPICVWSNWLQVHINLYHTSSLVCLSANYLVYDIMATSEPQKNVILV